MSLRMDEEKGKEMLKQRRKRKMTCGKGKKIKSRRRKKREVKGRKKTSGKRGKN